MEFAYTEIIGQFIDEFTTDPELVECVVIDAAERFRDDYYTIVDVDEDEFDRGVLDDFFEEVRKAIAEALRDNGLL